MSSSKEIIKSLKGSKPAPVYVLHGEEPYFIDEITQVVEGIIDSGLADFNRTILYGKDSNVVQIIDAARRLPVMADRQVVLVKEAQELKNIADLVDYINQPAQTTILCLAFKKKLDLRTKFATAIKKHAEVFHAKKLYENQVADWVTTWLSGKNYQITPEAAGILVESLGSDLAKIVNELEKLFLNIKPGMTIGPAEIHKYVGISKDYNVFELNKALGTKNYEKVFRILRHIKSNIRAFPFPLLLGSLSNYFGKIYRYHQVRHMAERDQLSALGLKSAWFIKEYKVACRYYSVPKLESVFEILASYDLRSKGVRNDQTSHESLLTEMILLILK